MKLTLFCLVMILFFMISSVYTDIDESVAEEVLVDQLQNNEDFNTQTTLHDTDHQVEHTLHDTEVLSTFHDADM